MKFNFYLLQLRNSASRQCVDSPAKQDDLHKPVGLWPCHLQGGNQVMRGDVINDVTNEIGVESYIFLKLI